MIVLAWCMYAVDSHSHVPWFNTSSDDENCGTPCHGRSRSKISPRHFQLICQRHDLDVPEIALRLSTPSCNVPYLLASSLMVILPGRLQASILLASVTVLPKRQ